MADKKFSPMRYTASTEEAAITGALQIVGVSRDEIEVEIIDQSAKGVTVRIRPRPAETLAPLESAVAETSLQDSAPITEDVPELLAQNDEESDEEQADETETGSAQIASDDDAEDPTTSHSWGESEAEIAALSGDAEELDALAADFAEETPDFVDESDDSSDNSSSLAETSSTPVAPEWTPLDIEIVARAQQKAQELLDKMGLDAQAQVDTAKEANTAALVVEGDDVGILIGKHGATLQAFQYLLNLTLNAHLEGEVARQSGIRVVVDAGNYRARRQSSLEQIARSAASKVRREGRVVRLEPMPAHERRLVHMFLQTESDVVTQSEGREPMRRIVVAPGVTGVASAPPRPERAPSSSTSGGAGSGTGNRSGFGAFRRGDAQSERNRGLQRGR